MSSRQDLQNALQAWYKERKTSTASNNTALFKLVIDDYTRHNGDCKVDLGWSKPQPYKVIFSNRDHRTEPLPMDSFEDLVAIRDLYKTLGIVERYNSGIRYGSVYTGLFYRPGWAREHNEWFMEEISEYTDFEIKQQSTTGERAEIEAECQVKYLTKALMQKSCINGLPDHIMSALCKHEPLWTIFEKRLFGEDALIEAGYGMLFMAYTVLHDKPVSVVFDAPWKNALSKSLRGDFTELKPLVHNHFIDSSWPKPILDTLRSVCTNSLQKVTDPYTEQFRSLVLTSPSRILAKYFANCKSPSKDHFESVFNGIDFDDLYQNNFELFCKVFGDGDDSIGRGSTHDDFKYQYLCKVPFEAAQKYVATYSDEILQSNVENGYLGDIDYAKLLRGDSFANRHCKRRDIDDREDVPGYDDQDTCIKSNSDKLHIMLPFGGLTYGQALLNLVLEKNIVDSFRSRLIKEVEDHGKYKWDHKEYRRGLELDCVNYTTDLEAFLEGFSDKAIIDNQKLLQTIAFYLLHKIKAGTAIAEDVGPRVRLALCMLTSKFIQ